MAWYTGKQALTILHIGDSNALGFGALEIGTQQMNPNVYCYTQPAGTPPYSEANCVWQVLDPNDASQTEGTDPEEGDPQMLQVLQGNGNTGMQAASTMQAETGIDTYLFGLYRGGADSTMWSNTGAGWAVLTRNVDTALASVPGSPSYFDAIIMSIGGLDIVNFRVGSEIPGVAPTDFLANLNSFRSNMIDRGWWVPNETQVAFTDAPRTRSLYQKDATWKYPIGTPYWNGFELVLNDFEDRMTFVTSTGFTYDNILLHPDPKWYTHWGRVLGERFVNQLPFAKPAPSVGGSAVTVGGQNIVFGSAY